MSGERDDVQSHERAQTATSGLDSMLPGATAHWATIESHLRNHDEKWIKKYSEDMDTLLVFAGLYSAILTAFIIEFYKQLQQDNTQITVALLSTISKQLTNVSTRAPLSMGPDASEIPFAPPAIWRRINALWFLSLLLSLAAALFAMMAKQWLREYLMWTSFSADPSEVVVLRQLRDDAWTRWKVPATIGAIPALLELSLVLFLSGIVALLWALDRPVAIVLSVFTGIFFLIVLIVTILPVFHLECPYKSPVNWACVYLWNKFAQALPANPRWNLYHYTRLSADSWVRRDLSRTTEIPRYGSKLLVAPDHWERAELAASVLVPMIQGLVSVRQDSEDGVVLTKVDHCITTVQEAADSVIFRRLAMTSDPAQEMLHRLHSALFATAKLFRLEVATLHDTVRASYMLFTPPHAARYGYMTWVKCVCRTKGVSLEDLIRPAVNASGAGNQSSAKSCSNEELSVVYGMLVSAFAHATKYILPTRAPHRPEWQTSQANREGLIAMPKPMLPIFAQSSYTTLPLEHSSTEVLSSSTSKTLVNVASSESKLEDPLSATRSEQNTQGAVDGGRSQPTMQMPLPSVAINTSDTPDLLEPALAAPHGLTSSRHMRPPVLLELEFSGFIDVFILTEAITSLLLHAGRGDANTDTFIECIAAMCRRLDEDTNLDAQYPGLRSLFTLTLCYLGNPDNVVHSGLLVEGSMDTQAHRAIPTSIDRYALMAMRLYPETLCRDRPEDWHLFVILTDMAFQLCEEIQDFSLLVELFELASKAVLNRARKGWRNCGCYHGLPWVFTLLWKVRGSVPLVLPWDDISKLVRTLEITLSEELTTDDALGLENGRGMAEVLAELESLCAAHAKHQEATGHGPFGRPIPQMTPRPASDSLRLFPVPREAMIFRNNITE